MFPASTLTFFLAFLIFTPQGFSAPLAEVSLSKDKLNTSETAELRIQFRWPKVEAAYTFAVPDLPLQNLTVTNQAESQETFLKDNQVWSQKDFIFELSPKDAGVGEMGDFSISYINPATGAQGDYAVAPLKLQITKTREHRNIFAIIFVLIATGTVFTLIFVLKGRKTRLKQVDTNPQTEAIRAIKKRIQTASASVENAVPNLGKDLLDFLNEVYGKGFGRQSEMDILTELKVKKASPEEVRFIEKTFNQIREFKYTGQKMSESDFHYLKKEITAFMDSKQIHSFSSVH